MFPPRFAQARRLRGRAKASTTATLCAALLTHVVSCARHPSQRASLDGRPTEASAYAARDAGLHTRDAGLADGAFVALADARPADGGAPKLLPDGGPRELTTPGERPSVPLSFLVITVDTLRPDLGCMGYQQPVSPHIDKLAERAVVYERAYAISTYTAFCLPPMMASRYPSEMPRTDRHEVKYLRENVLLAERLKTHGYYTAGAASHFLFAPMLGWIDGFDRFIQVQSEGKAPPGAGVDRFHSSRKLADAAIRLLAEPQVAAGPFFLWVHFLDPHKHYLKHPGFSNFGTDPRGLYDGEIAYTDHHVGRLLDALAASPARDRTAVFLTADHGEAFGEHGFFFHGSEVWDEVVRVPLVVSVPGVVPRKISRRVSVVEVAPTILDLAGVAADPGARGPSFALELYGGVVPERPILIDQPHNPYYETRRAFIDHDYKLHHYPESGAYLLFDLSRDQGEHRDLAVSHPDLLKKVQGAYETFMASVPQVTPRAIAPAKPASAR